MSYHEAMIEKARSALSSIDPTSGFKEQAAAVVDYLLPEIADPRQMLGVPEGSILIVEVQAGARPVRWEGGLLHGYLRADQMPMNPQWVIERYGPMTVVWMP